MVNRHVAVAIANIAIFMSFSDPSVLDEDAAVQALGKV
jgi:hypothetical protein